VVYLLWERHARADHSDTAVLDGQSEALLLLRDMLAKGDYWQSLDALDRLLAEDPNNPELLKLREQLLARGPLAGRDNRQALGLLDRLLASDPNNPELLKLRELLAGGDSRQALDMLDRLLATDPNNPELLRLREQLLRDQQLAEGQQSAEFVLAAQQQAENERQQREVEAQRLTLQRLENERLLLEAEAQRLAQQRNTDAQRTAAQQQRSENERQSGKPRLQGKGRRRPKPSALPSSARKTRGCSVKPRPQGKKPKLKRLPTLRANSRIGCGR